MKKYLLLSCGLIFFDQMTKLVILLFLKSPVTLIFDFFQLVLKTNEGIAFSIPIYKPLLIPLLILIIFCGTIVSYFHLDWDNKIHAFIFAFVFSGAIGNLMDRFLYGGVIDFIKIGFWPVFNVADIFITIGVFLSFYDILVLRKSKKHS